jgi:riboflavin transporter FmnP
MQIKLFNIRSIVVETLGLAIPRNAIARFAVATSLYIALSVLLPVGFHQIGLGGRMWLPMHIPALMAGFLVGPLSGLIVGATSPGLSSLLTGMPPQYAIPLMSMELMMYGLVAGVCYNRLRINVYLSLVLAMLLGRVLFGAGIAVLGSFMEIPYTAVQWFSTGGAMVTGWPGLLVQMAVIPIIVAGWKWKRKL